LQLTVDKGADGAVVDADADRLNQVLINLISNAIKYNDAPEPVVEVRSRRSRRHYIVEVSDNGPGIARDERVLVFEKFARGGVGAAATPGAGLGLAISRQIVGHMNGKLELLPTRGRGACFRITLPLSAGVAPMADVPPKR
jgi:signal transduction histidine kinase